MPRGQRFDEIDEPEREDDVIEDFDERPVEGEERTISASDPE